MNKRQFLKTVAAASASAAMAQQHAPETHIYKVAAGCEIKADVLQDGVGKDRPALLWIHGGALISGSRKQTGTPLVGNLVKMGYVVVSIDYRLAPNTKLPQIIEDVEDAWRWMRKESKRLGIDPARMATAGGSAGGYLTLMTGFCVEPRPRALVSYFGYGEIDSAWYAEPDVFYRKQPLVSKEEAWESVGKQVVSEPPNGSNRGRFYLYCRQQGLWPNEVAGRDPHQEPNWFDRYNPIRNVTKRYPPTLLIHGTADTDVPYEQSKMMADKLAAAGVKHELITVPGGAHGLGNAKPEEKEQFTKRAVEWVHSHMSS